MEYFIYALADPRTDVVAYVGLTNNAYARFKQHISGVDSNGKKHEWIQQLQNNRLIPSMKIIEIVETLEQAQQREAYWMRFYREQGFILCNIRNEDYRLDRHKISKSPKQHKATLPPKTKPVKIKPVKVRKPRDKYTRLFILRTLANMSQRKLSEVSGVYGKTIVDIEKGKSWPTTDTVGKLCDALGITSEDFFTADPSQADGKEEERRIAC